MELGHRGIPDRMYTDDGHVVHCKILRIEDWNMDVEEYVTIPHGLGVLVANIISVNVMIISDGGATWFPLNRMSNAVDPDLVAGGVQIINGVSITLYRRTGGWFDSVSFNQLAYNRGHIFIWYYE